MPRERKKTKKTESLLNSRITFSSADSYKSLFYGIATVIILFIIGFGAVKLFLNRPTPEIDNQAVSIKNLTIESASPTPEEIVSDAPTQAPAESTATPTPLRPTPTSVLLKPTNTPVLPAQVQPKQMKGTHIVKTGESLWDIAEKEYNDGYKWIQIAQANNLANPGTIFKNDRLVIPKETVTPTPPLAMVSPKITSPPGAGMNTGKISGASYTVQRGDDLWNIAVRAYGDGYKWVDIARVNKLTNPNLIFKDNVLKLPR